MSYSISQVARMMGVTPSTLRYYDQEGLLPHIKRVNGMRVFEDEDFRWLRVLNCLKNTKMPIKKIRKYVELAQKGDETLQERYQLIQEQKEYILSQIQEYQYYLQEIEYKEWYYQQAIQAGSEESVKKHGSNHATLEVARIPEEHDFIQQDKVKTKK